MSNHNHINCPHCESIRQTADLLITLTFLGWSMEDTAQCLAVLHARIRRQGVNEFGIDSLEEKYYLKWFNEMCDREFQYLNEKQPIEPLFDEEFDFRKVMK